MDTLDALAIISDFKGKDLKSKLNDLKAELLGKSRSEIRELQNLYEAALEVKKVSAQVDEIVHATGIIKCLPLILQPNEEFESLSLAAGSDGEGFDLVTDVRVAEFKFSRWQNKGSNGSRKRQVFADFVNLTMFNTKKNKELYVFNSKRIKEYLQSKKASWRKVLSKSGGLEKELEAFLRRNGVDGTDLNAVFRISTVSIIDIDTVLTEDEV